MKHHVIKIIVKIKVLSCFVFFYKICCLLLGWL